jgi:hypothetical protein
VSTSVLTMVASAPPDTSNAARSEPFSSNEAHL